MTPLLDVVRTRAAFSAIQALAIRHPRRTSTIRRSVICQLNSRLAYSSVSGPSSTIFRVQGSLPTLSVAIPSSSFPSFLRFDKVPEKLPDWWDDEEDDDDEDSQRDKHSGGGEGGGNDDSGGSSGGRGQGGGDDGGPEGNGEQQGFLAVLLAAYTRAIQNAPVRTKAISTCVLALTGDLLAQKIAQRDSSFTWDRRRSLSIGLWAFCFMGPMLHSWYGLLDRMFSGRYAVWKKVLSDQIMFAPFFNGAFLVGVGCLEGNPVKEVSHTVKTKIWPSMKANWTLWPAAQFVNFAFVPKTFQIVYVNCVALVWNVILTYISHEKEEQKDSL